jgi:hypothetical protein
VIIPFPKKNKFLSLVGHIVFQKENSGQNIPFSENCVPNTNMTDKGFTHLDKFKVPTV